MDVMADADEGDAQPPPTAYAPAYALGGCGGAGSGPQCSAFPDEFCFFCHSVKDVDAANGATADLYGSMTTLVQTMSESNKEFMHIVNALHHSYMTLVRPILNSNSKGGDDDDDDDDDDEDAMDGEEEGKPRFVYPAWGHDAIARHLTYSSQFRPVFQAGVTQILHSIINGHNRRMFDANTNEVIEPERAALMSTLNMYMKWEKFNG
jgi:hypothetical protein